MPRAEAHCVDDANRAFIAKNIQAVVHRSVEAAVAQTELVGKVSVGDVREVKAQK